MPAGAARAPSTLGGKRDQIRQQSSPPPLRVWIRATLGERLVLEVGNTGHWCTTAGESSTGIGLANLRRRLELIAGPTAELTVQAEPEQVRVVLRLPIIKTP